MRAGTVALDAARQLGRGVFPGPPRVPTRVDGRKVATAIVWLNNGYGVSLVSVMGEGPELLIVRDDAGDWVADAVLTVSDGTTARTTDGYGVMRDVRVGHVVALLRQMQNWNGGRHWSHPRRTRR